MNFFHSLLLGAVQGATEFLPISSSGHLYLFETWLGIVPSLELEIWFHVASLVAVIGFFRNDIWQIILGMLGTLKIKLTTAPSPEKGMLGWKLLVATMATVPTALVFQSWFFEKLSLQLVGVTLLITAAAILLAEKGRSPLKNWLGGKGKHDFPWWLAITLGFVQGMTVVPGISRSGMTIAFLILLGVERKKAAEISFLLAIPTIAGAMGFALTHLQIPWSWSLLLGGMICFAVSWMAIAWMMKLVEKNWIWFAVYCGVVGMGLLVL